MYITVSSIKKTLGKWLEFQDLYIGLPLLFTFLILFTLTPLKTFSIILLTISVFMMLPVNISKKNRMYKVLIMFVKFIFKEKEYIYTKERCENEKK